MIEHHAEIAHIKPAFKELKLNRGRPMASASQGRPESGAANATEAYASRNVSW
jgi:hypothetical protein